MLLDAAGPGLEGEAPHIAPRREHNPFAPVRPCALYCYGVDFLSNKEVLDLFGGFQPKEVEWLDDSSCNVVFGSEDVPARVLRELASPVSEGAPPPEHWTVTKPLTVGQGQGKQQRQQKGSKAAKPKMGLREFRLELRLATEADRKDPGHSGHTDSVYYAHVKEQQALQRQAAELRRFKKRQRRSRIPSAEEAQPVAAEEGGASASGASEVTTAGATGGGEAELEDDSWADGVVSAPGRAEQAPAAGADGATGGIGGALAGAGTAPLPRLGCRGLLDPLLFLRAPGGSTGAGGGADAGAGGPAPGAAEATGGDAGQAQRKNEDLLSALRRAEAEYTAVLHPGAVAAAAAGNSAPARQERGRQRSRPLARGAGGGRGRQATPGRGRRRTPGKGGGRERTPPPRSLQEGTQQQQQQQQQRGKKRRPVEQEPRPVSSVGPPPRKLAALPEVEAFLSEHRVRCQRYHVKHTFRSIKFGQTKKHRAPFGGKPPIADLSMEQANAKLAPVTDGAQVGGLQVPASKDTALSGEKDVIKGDLAASGRKAGDEQETSPWERYLKANHNFTQNGQFMHTVAWEAEGRQILTVVPHPTRVDVDRVARAVQKPRSQIRQRKLKDIEKQTGWPVFVCVPFGHPKDSEGRDPVLLVDSTVVEFKRPLLFDCGTVGLSIPVSEFFRSTGAACIEGLGKTSLPVVPMAPSPNGPPMALAPGGATAMPASPEPAPEPGPTGAATTTCPNGATAVGGTAAASLPPKEPDAMET